MTDFLDPLFLIRTVGLIGVFGIIFVESGLFFGFFFPGDSLLFTAGLLAAGGYFSFPVLLTGVFITAVFGSLFGYLFGKHVGRSLFTKEDSLFFNKKHLIRSHEYYEKHGKMTLVLARFMPIVRTFAPIVAGIANMNFRDFMVYNMVGALVWSAGLCGLGYYLGIYIPEAEKYILPIVVAIIVLSFLPAIVKFLRRKNSTASEPESAL